MSRLDLSFGPMKSGKTTELIIRLSQLVTQTAKVLYVNHGIDMRTDGAMSTHSPVVHMDSRLSTQKVTCLNDVNATDFSVIGIDEAQFFEDLSPILQWVDEGKHVIVSSLSGDYKQDVFGNVFSLIPNADNVTFRKAICEFCGKDAPFSMRSSNDKNQILVGNDYHAVCRECLNATL